MKNKIASFVQYYQIAFTFPKWFLKLMQRKHFLYKTTYIISNYSNYFYTENKQLQDIFPLLGIIII